MLTAAEIKTAVATLEANKKQPVVVDGIPYYVVEGVKDSIHGHDTGMRHVNCGGEIYYDWTVTYEYEGATIPAFRCVACKQEILGDVDVVIPRFEDR